MFGSWMIAQKQRRRPVRSIKANGREKIKTARDENQGAELGKYALDGNIPRNSVESRRVVASSGSYFQILDDNVEENREGANRVKSTKL